MKRVLLFPVMLVALLAANCQPSGSEASKSEATAAKVALIETNELKQLLDERSDLQLIDVRTPKEFNGGTIGEAINVNFFDPDFEQQLMNVVDTEKPLYLFCRSGRRSANAAEKLKESGFTEIFDLKGGYLKWMKEN